MPKRGATISMLTPGLADNLAAGKVDKQHYDEPPRQPGGILHTPTQDTRVAGQVHGAGGVEPK